MGRLAALDMIYHGGRDAALTWHLQSNHYPPVDLAFAPACREAIEAVDAGEPEQPVTLPNGVTMDAAQIVDELHLAAFLDEGNRDDEDEDEVEG